MSITYNFLTHIKPESDFFSLHYNDALQKFFQETIDNQDIGFFKLTENKDHLKSSKRIFDKFKDKKQFIQIGIGGSALGPQMLVDSLGESDVEFFFLDNTDADYTKKILKKLNLDTCLFYVVSKSGGTAETIANFIICQNFLLENGIAQEDLKKYFVLCTDPKNGHLRELADSQNYSCLEVPSNIGGRFSVLSPVGLLPALFAGIDIDKLYQGANNLKAELVNNESYLFKTASQLAHLLNDPETRVNQTILMPYSSKLKSFSHWFVQLWGESLGKYSMKLGRATGLTPIPAYGATDQHSQMQLFMEGENDKFLFLLNIKKRENDFKLKSTLGIESAKKLENYSLNQLIEAQFHGTLNALSDMKRNVIHIELDQLNEENLGGLIIYFESLTALMGKVLEVDPFNQPGVELGKKYAYKYLKKFD